RRGVREGHAFFERGVCVDHARRDSLVVLVETALERCGRLVHGARLDVDLGAAAPDHHRPLQPMLAHEAADVLAYLFGKIPLAGPALDVRTLETLDVVAVEYRGQGTNRLQLGAQLL